ncbi:MAG: SxtJ family membrane protein [Pseudodesulfovibrio sp.]
MIDTKHTARQWLQPPSARECADTGMAMVLICLLAAWFTGERGWLAGAIGLLVLNMTGPRAFALPARLWLGLSRLLGAVMSRVILSLAFFLVLTPVALLRRALGHDPMRRKGWKAGTASVFETRDHTYTPEEIERPF